METNVTNLSGLFKQEGTSRAERFAPELDPSNLLIDDRKLEDFIVFARRYARNLVYVNGDANSESGTETWESFFANDSVVFLARIATINLADLKAGYNRLVLKFNSEPTPERLSQSGEYVLSLYQKMNNWYYATNDHFLQSEIRGYIQSFLKKELYQLREILIHGAELQGNTFSKEEFTRRLFDNSDIPTLKSLRSVASGSRKNAGEKSEDALLKVIDQLLIEDDVWELRSARKPVMNNYLFVGNENREKLLNASYYLRQLYDAILHGIETLKLACANYFKDHLFNRNDHPPHIAFFLTFFKLFGFVQDALNKIPLRHLEFYYREVLRIAPKAGVPDTVFILFEPAKGFLQTPVLKGTLLSAGKDHKGNPLNYSVDKDVLVTQAKVRALNTIFIAKDPFDNNLNYNYYTGNIPVPETSTEEVVVFPSRKLFGESGSQMVGEIGFAIASSQFFLARGERQVSITFLLEEELAQEAFDTSLIKLQLTGETGWLTSDTGESGIRIVSLTRTEDKSIVLTFSISIAERESIVAFNPKIHPGNFTTVLPVVQCLLQYPSPESMLENDQVFKSKIAQLNILQHLRIRQTSISVKVGSITGQVSFDGVTDLVVENHDSVLDNKKPFYPFTPVPVVGSSFYIGCKDMYYKKINKLSVNIEWMLPDDYSSHYQTYLPPYDSNKHLASLSVLTGQYWRRIKDVSLIDTDTKDPAFRSVKIDYDQLRASIENKADGIPAYDNSKKNGTIQFKLNYPDFGHSVYPQLITSAVMEKAASKSSSVDFYKIVKKELRDSAISIKLPDDIKNRNGSLKVIVYDVLERVNDDQQARTMLINGLSKLIRSVNGSNIIFRKGKPFSEHEEVGLEETNTVLVNDDNLIGRFLGLLSNLRLISKKERNDRDKESVSDLMDDVKEKVYAQADFIMPSDREMIAVISNETNAAINKTVVNVVEELIEIRKNENAPPSPQVVSDILNNEFVDANEVINDMIAKKIAIILSANEVPRPPYTPVINNISVSYSSTKDSDEGGDQFYYVTPFGVTEIVLPGRAVPDYSERLITNFIFPRSIISNDPAKGRMSGMAFIGLERVEVNHKLSLLFQFAEGTRSSDQQPPKITWWYLKNTLWIEMPNDSIVSDSTYGLQNTGIVELSIRPDLTNIHPLFGQTGLYWLCASVASGTQAFPDLISITTNAATATFVNQDNDPGHLSLPLPAGKINNLLVKTSAIKSVHQPVSSFNGKAAESGMEFNTRVSERLRHKGRAISNWDYERIVLEQFPFLYKVKCINNFTNGHFAVGHVTLVPITDLRNRNHAGSDMLFPKTNYLDLRTIENFVQARTSPFVKVHVINPRLDHVVISCKVRFHRGVDNGFYLQKLNKELVRFLTPWASGDLEALSFSGRIYSSAIVSFIDKREYVDFVSNVIMRQYTLDEQGNRKFVTEEDQLESLVETQVTTNYSILVSAPGHDIELAD